MALFRIIPWKVLLALSYIILICLIVLNFYGLYSNRFYFLKFDNYILPAITVIHFIYLYVIRFKIREMEYPDPQMRNLEYALYVIFLVYLFKAFDTLFTVMTYSDYDEHLIPATFLPMGITIVILYVLLMYLTLSLFRFRKESIGEYQFDNLNENIDPWP